MKRRKKVIGPLLAVAILGSVITFGASQIYPLSFNKAKNAAVNLVQNLNWSWTGLSGKTLWDVLELSSRLAIPVLIAVFTYVVQKRDKEKIKEQDERDKKKAEKQAEVERDIASNNLAEEAIQAYLDRMSDLLLNKELRKDLFPNVNDKLNPSGYDNPVRDVARTQTITILRRLEEYKERQGRIIDFLRDTELYKFIFKNVNLSGINLSQAKLYKINLQKASLESANLEEADLSSADLQQAVLSDVNLQKASLESANLQQAVLLDVNFELESANLKEADLSSANLQQAVISDANLQGANLYKANLEEADLRLANLQQAFLAEVEDLTPKQIKSACFWDEAIYRSEWNEEKQAWVAIEPDNTNFIEELKNDIASDPEEHPDCSIWDNSNEAD